MKNKVSFKASNFNKLTPSFWKKVGNTANYSLPLLQAAVIASPFSAEARLWVGFVLTVALIGTKTLTKFFSEESN